MLVDNDAKDLGFKNSYETMPLNDLVDVLKKMEDYDLNAVFSSIQSLSNDEKEYLLNQIEA